MGRVIMLLVFSLFALQDGCNGRGHPDGPPQTAADEHYTGLFWAAMRAAGFTCLAAVEKQGVKAEIWNVQEKGGVLQAGWVVSFVGERKLSTFSFGSEGTLEHAGGTIKQYNYGSLDRFTLSDKYKVYTKSIHDNLEPPKGTVILTQGFKVRSDLEGPLTFVFNMTVDYGDQKERIELRGENIPVEAIEK